MALLSRHFLNLSEQFRYPITHLCHRFLNIPPIDKVCKNEKENTEGTTKQAESQIICHKKDCGPNVVVDYKPDIKVCIIGGGIIPLYTAVLLKQYPIIKSIHLVDTRDSISSIVTDTHCMDAQPHIKYFRRNEIKQGLKEVNIVALMDEMDIMPSNIKLRIQFKTATDYVRHMTDQILRFCPDALVVVMVQPVTATLAMISEIFRCSGWWNPNKIIGSVATYAMRVEQMTAEFLNLEHSSLSVPIAGGADARTIVPLLSRAIPFNQFTNEQHRRLLQSFRAIDVEARKCDTSKSLSYGTAATKLIIALARGLCGFDNIITCAYVRSDVMPVCRFFTSELELGPDGINRNLGLPKISPTEIFLIEQGIPIINEFVDMAVKTVRTERMQARTR